MMFLKRGHRGPKVVTAQTLLNRRTPGIALAVDGIFGPRTRQGVIAFQRHYVLGVDGIIGEETWGRLMSVSGLQTVELVDMTAEDLGGAVADIRNNGGDPIVMRGMSNGVGQAMQFIAQRAGGSDSIVLLRIYAHGAPGTINVSAGVEDFDADLAGIALSNFAQIRASLLSIRRHFRPFASVEFHGCEVGQGVSGRRLVQQLADVWGVPVTAAIRVQLVGGGARYTFRHEGPVVTGYPGGAGLRAWARNVGRYGAVKIAPGYARASF